VRVQDPSKKLLSKKIENWESVKNFIKLILSYQATKSLKLFELFCSELL